MKKFKALLLTSLTAVLLCVCFLFAGCGASGTYKFKYVEIAGIEYKVGDTWAGETIDADDFEAITLNKDGTIKDMEGAKWEEKDGKIIITMGEGEEARTVAEFTKDGNKLIVEQEGMKIVYKK